MSFDVFENFDKKIFEIEEEFPRFFHLKIFRNFYFSIIKPIGILLTMQLTNYNHYRLSALAEFICSIFLHR